jgi:8-oxo-dGTP pyrophosphatase MutT (NUDIX family)
MLVYNLVMPHIHTKPGQYDFSVSAVLVRLFPDGVWRVWLHNHKIFDKYMFVGGHVELNENPWECITHELAEESGYDIAQLELLFSDPLPGYSARPGYVELPKPFHFNYHAIDESHSHIDIDYVFRALDEPTIPLGDGESTDTVWLSADELKALPDSKVFENNRNLHLDVLSKVEKL